MIELIKVDGSRTELKAPILLHDAQKHVGGYVEIVKTINQDKMLVDEEGKIKGKEINKVASEIYGFDMIVGDVILLTGKDKRSW